MSGEGLGNETVCGFEARAGGDAAFGFGTAAGPPCDPAFNWGFAGALAGFFGPCVACLGAAFEERFTFEVVVRPPGLECRFALRGDLLRIRRCRSIWLIQV